MGTIYINKAVKEDTSAKNYKVAEALGANDKTKRNQRLLTLPATLHSFCLQIPLACPLVGVGTPWPVSGDKKELDGPSFETLLTYPQLALRYAFKNLKDLPAPHLNFSSKSVLLLAPSSLLWIKMVSIFSWEKEKEHSQEPL